MNRELLTPDEVAEILKVSKFTIYEMVKRGELQAHRIGRNLRFDSKHIESYIKFGISSEHASNNDEIGIENNSTNLLPTIFVGSHDLSVEALFQSINQSNKVSKILPAFVGSMDGLLSLYHGKADIVGCHLFDFETGIYNLPYIKRLFVGERIFILPFISRNIGWIIQKGNPQHISGVEDIKRTDIKIVNRQKGAGTRILLDYYLKNEGVHKEKLNGYSFEKTTHYGVAAAVANGEADIGLGTESAASTMALDFVKLREEHYDFVFKEAFRESETFKVLLKEMQSTAFKKHVKSLGGYKLSDSIIPEEVW